MNPVFYIFRIVPIIRRFNSNVATKKWYAANKEFIKELGISVRRKLLNFPKKNGVLVYANHPTGLDPYLLSSILERDDVWIVSDIYQTRKGKAVASHLIPVYYSRWFDVLKRSGIAFLGYLMMRFFTGTKPKETTLKLNQLAIEKAIQHITDGHTVIIFPSGGEKQNRQWKKGIGEILFSCYKKKVRYTLYNCTINDLTENKLLYHFITGKRYLFDHPISIYGRIVDNKFITQQMTPREITSILQSKNKTI